MIASRPHRAVVALLRAGLGLPAGEGAAEDVRRTPPERLLGIAASHRVLQLLGGAVAAGHPLAAALEPDAAIFLAEMRRGAAARNVRMTTALAALGRTLAEAGREAVVLKGGAELALGTAGGERFVGDLDLLVPAGEAEALHAALRREGWVAAPMPAIERARHHHLPALAHPDHGVSVEIHRRLGDALTEAALPSGALLAEAEGAGLPGLRVPSRRHRIAHLMLHAQLAEAGWADRRLRLCDAADLVRLGALEAAPVAGPEAAACEGLRRAAALLLSDRPAEGSDPAAVWARAAVARVGRPRALRWSRLRRRLIWRAGALIGDGERRRHWAARLARLDAAPRLLAALRRELSDIR